jgi:sodium/potassium-transporting ATPase subunit alpha
LSINVSETISRPAARGKGDGNAKSISELEWHVITADEAIRRLRTSETRGLDDDQVERRLKEYGRNVLTPPPSNRLRK